MIIFLRLSVCVGCVKLFFCKSLVLAMLTIRKTIEEFHPRFREKEVLCLQGCVLFSGVGRGTVGCFEVGKGIKVRFGL